MGINTNDVLEAAGTKWNFSKYNPGIVGGYCIRVDSCYLAHKVEVLDYYSQVILSGRRVNVNMEIDNMAMFITPKGVINL